MAGDWIKVRHDLIDDPDVVRIMSACDADIQRTLGGLVLLWTWADRHCADGLAVGLTPEWLDRHTGIPGFADALVTVGWIELDGGIRFLNFDRHNGCNAKRRASETKRKSSKRADVRRSSASDADTRPQPVRKVSASDADKVRTREEKRREEKKKETPSVDVHTDEPAEAPAGGVVSDSHSGEPEVSLMAMLKQAAESATSKAPDMPTGPVQPITLESSTPKGQTERVSPAKADAIVSAVTAELTPGPAPETWTQVADRWDDLAQPNDLPLAPREGRHAIEAHAAYRAIRAKKGDRFWAVLELELPRRNDWARKNRWTSFSRICLPENFDLLERGERRGETATLDWGAAANAREAEREAEFAKTDTGERIGPDDIAKARAALASKFGAETEEVKA